jgi:putative two-component system response regulator
MEPPEMIVIIVDDIELNCVLLAEAIHCLDGCVPQYFTDPEAAVAFIRANCEKIGVMITDFHMPQLNGIQLMKMARAVPGFQHVPIVMLTSNEGIELRREALEAGVTDFMNKPFELYEIRARIGNLLALSNAHRREQQRTRTLAEEVAASVAIVEAREREIVERLVSAAEHRDTDTSEHIQRVATYVGLIAHSVGLDADYCRMIALASTMHDIGKIAVPDSVLLKPGRLDTDERVVMEKHAELGYQVLAGSTSTLIQLAAEIALTHHERWDGTGYPHKLVGEAIPFSGRIAAVADVVDALLSERPYKKAWSFSETKAYLLADRGRHFDPTCVAALLANWGKVELVASNQSRKRAG